MAILEIKNLTKKYPGNKIAVDNLSLSIEPGDIYGFIGHNGAGKTTTLKAIAGIIGFEEGYIGVDGMSVRDNQLDVKKVMAYVPDNPDLYDYLTGIQYLNFIADVFNISKEDRQRDIKQYAEKFELYGDLGNLISSYSHGMKQKLALIGALIHHPKLLMLDEPFVGLDPMAALRLKEMMHQLCEEGGAIFFSTHVLDVAEKLCNKIAIIKKGSLIASGTIDELTNGKSLEEVFMEVVTNVK